MQYDLILRGGTVVDGTGAPRFVGDVGIVGDRVAKVGQVEGAAKREIDVSGLIVAPGVIDLHTHYDAQLHWDPYCTASGWHGTTTVMMGNCGFGFAPVRPGMADRYMLMMENTEQVPYDCMKRTMSWDWETFPEWMDHLRSLPKGLNVATYLPMNPLLCYVVGADEAKKRPATEAERAEMRRIMHEAMDAGAAGFAFSYLGGEGNSHVDYDQTPMPTDIMAEEEAYNLAEVLRERKQGIIQILCELPGMAHRRDFAENLARRSGRPVLHNILGASDTNPEIHRSVLRWLDQVHADGLDIWAQGFTFRKPIEIHPMHYCNWDAVPAYRMLSLAKTREEKIALVQDKEYRDRFEKEYEPEGLSGSGGGPDIWVLMEASASKTFAPYEGQTIEAIARRRGRSVPSTLLDILEDSGMEVLFVNPVAGAASAEAIAELLQHPRVLAGVSDGGAHSKHGNGGFWSTDLLVLMTRETNTMSLEAVHNLLSARNAEAGGIRERGSLVPGNYADVVIYDAATLNYDPPLRYLQLHDLPGGDWRKVKKAVGVRYVLVNGQVTFVDGEDTGAIPGILVADQPPAERRQAAE